MENNIDQKIIEYVSKLFYYDSSLNAKNYPIDIEYFSKNMEVLNKITIEDFMIYNFNNFPELYNHRFMLCVLDELLKIEEENWCRIIKKINGRLPLEALYNFFYSYLKVDLNINKCLASNTIKYNQMFDDDDDDFIKENELNPKINALKNQVLEFNLVNQLSED